MSTILITGASGFIGCRLAEVATERGIPVVGLVRTWPHAARLARLPVRLVHGDILDLDSLREAMKGCSAVFHCAIDTRDWAKHYRSSVTGTANVMQAALEAGVERVVHLSSVAVYSYRPGPDAAREEGAYRYSRDVYCNGKIDSEKIALRYARRHGLPVTILRPTAVYGPFGLWTMIPVNSILRGEMVLVDGGRGTCNSLYVDNLVEAMMLARERGGTGDVYHVSDARPVSWRAFIEAHARALGDSFLPLPEMSASDIRAARASLRRSHPSSARQLLNLLSDPRTRRALRSVPIIDRCAVAAGIVRRVLRLGPGGRSLEERLPNDPSAPRKVSPRSGVRSLPSQNAVDNYTVNIVFSIEKARNQLGYDPKIGFAEGIERTAAWIRWARLSSGAA